MKFFTIIHRDSICVTYKMLVFKNMAAARKYAEKKYKNLIDVKEGVHID